MFNGNFPKQLSFRVRVEHHVACMPAAWACQRLRPRQLSTRHLQGYKQTVQYYSHSSVLSDLSRRPPSSPCHVLPMWYHPIHLLSLFIPPPYTESMNPFHRPDWDPLISLRVSGLVCKKAHGGLHNVKPGSLKEDLCDLYQNALAPSPGVE